METLEVHSKSFMIKWVTVPEGSVLTWQIKPNKKSINFGLYVKSRDTASSLTPGSSVAGGHGGDNASTINGTRERSSSMASNISFEERLEHNGLSKVQWHGRCPAEEYLRGRFEAPAGGGGVYALVFDNTFSKTTAKQVSFSHRIEKKGAETDVVATEEVVDTKDKATCVSDGRYLTGVMYKKRRKRHQGFGRRWFCLDYKHGLLNYYLNQRSTTLRGTMPIQLCVVTARESAREIFIDSGMEAWDLKAMNMADFRTWIQAFDVAGTTNEAVSNARPGTPVKADNEEWDTIKGLVKRLENVAIVAHSDSFLTPPPPVPQSPPLDAGGDRKLQRRPSFWKRRSSKESKKSKQEAAPPKSPQPNNTGSSPFSSANGSTTSLNDPAGSSSSRTTSRVGPQLDEIVQEFKHLITSHEKIREATREAASMPPTARQSMDGRESIMSDEFFDAKEALEGVVFMDEDNEEEDEVLIDDDDDSTTESVETKERLINDSLQPTHTIVTNDLYPLPHEPVTRRVSIKPDNGPPPSLISVVKKNVGKDLSAIPMPVTMNEPLSSLQRVTEIMEYSELLDHAAATDNAVDRVMQVAVFALSYLSTFRAKERCVRKPFNPMLGETFELVREDKGFRLVCEKVCHRPVVLALQAESAEWTVSYTSKPHQKFWGKSMEFTDPGPIRVTINKTGERFEFVQPSMFMRNIIAGEKYLEPVGSCIIYSTSGTRALIEYKAGGMFSGRSEDLVIKGFDYSGAQHPTIWSGKWTESVSNDSGEVWKAGLLTRDYHTKYGFTEYAAGLNETTEIEQEALAPTDARNRPDLRLYEDGEVTQAEEMKQKLEHDQRTRRKAFETAGIDHHPSFFDQLDENTWALKEGDDNYWFRRRTGNWDNATKLW